MKLATIIWLFLLIGLVSAYSRGIFVSRIRHPNSVTADRQAALVDKINKNKGATFKVGLLNVYVSMFIRFLGSI